MPLVSLQGQGEGETEGAKGRGFLCTFCGTHIRRSDNYHRHMRKHSGEARFLCTVCLKPFSRSDALNAHMAKRHPSHKEGISSWGHARLLTHRKDRGFKIIFIFSQYFIIVISISISIFQAFLHEFEYGFLSVLFCMILFKWLVGFRKEEERIYHFPMFYFLFEMYNEKEKWI